MMKKIAVFIVLIVIVTSCRLEETERRGPLHIVTTTGIIEDVVENIVGDSAEVSTLMGPGTDPHLYKPTPADIELLDEADIIISNGLHLEGKMADMLDKYSSENQEHFDINISRDDLASIVGTATESVIRTLSEFKHDGFISIIA